MRPMRARLLKERVRHTHQQARLGWHFIDQGGMILVMDGEIRPYVTCQRYLAVIK